MASRTGGTGKYGVQYEAKVSFIQSSASAASNVIRLGKMLRYVAAWRVAVHDAIERIWLLSMSAIIS